MIDWFTFARRAPEIAAAGTRLLKLNEVALLGSVTKEGRPRIHPFVPRFFDDKLIAFIGNHSPKFVDLKARQWYAIHAMPAPEDEEFYIAGRCQLIDADETLRQRAWKAMGFVTTYNPNEILFEFEIDRALWTRWLDFGTAKHRPEYVRWNASMM